MPSDGGDNGREPRVSIPRVSRALVLGLSAESTGALRRGLHRVAHTPMRAPHERTHGQNFVLQAAST